MAFAGWTTAPYSMDVEYEDKALVKNLASEQNATVTMYALWKAEEDILPVPSREGYLFLGWSTTRLEDFPHGDNNTKDEVRAKRVGKVVGEIGGLDPIANNDNYARYAPSEDQTLYAMWYDNRTHIYLDSNY